MRSAVFYKFLSGVLALLLALGGAYAAKLIHDTRLEVDHFRQQQAEVQGKLDAMRVQLGKFQETFQRLQTDPDFLDRVARASLKNYARPDELVFRFDVDPLTGTVSAGNIDSARPTLKAPALPPGQLPAPANSTGRHH